MNTPPKQPMKERETTELRQERLRSFASLIWYEEVIKFLFTFAAKTAEVLLAAGLIVSTSNFLTDGKVMGSGTGLATAWAWAQALAIDSSLGVTFYYVFSNVKDRDWVKVVCYSLLTALLAIVAGTITNVDTFSHAIHIPIANAITEVGLDVRWLTTLRSIAVVGFVLMSRLKDVSFKELYGNAPSTTSLGIQESKTQEEVERTTALVRQLVAEALAQQGRRVIIEEQEMLPSSVTIRKEISEQQGSAVASRLDEENQGEQSDDLSEERNIKLLHAYQELEAEGKRISGRSLAARAHIRRSTCNQWLALYHPESVDEDE